MLNRSKIVIDVEPFIRAQTLQFKSRSGAACRTGVAVKRPRQLSAADFDRAARRTAPFPNGDVRDDLTLDGTEPLRVIRNTA
jgi:hypothetical protein